MDFDFRGVLRCPTCEEGEIQGGSCHSCGEHFDDEDGTLRLFSHRKGQVYLSPYIALEDIKANLLQSLRRPDDSGASLKVHHLDKAHIPYFENLPEDSAVLEVGCGGGQMRQWVNELGLRYCGTDVSRTRVSAHLQQYGGPDFLSDVHNLPVKDESFDLVYSAAVTEHLAAPHRAVQEIFRVLRPGGTFLGNCSFLEPWHDESFFHVSPNGAAALLLQAGFEPIAIWPSKGYSGYKSLLVMDNKATSALRIFGSLMQAYSQTSYALKRIIRGDRRYSNSDHLRDLCKTAGAIDWIARKPR